MSSELPRKPVVAYYPGDKSIESGAPPLTWLWDEYPLAPGSWGNIQAFYDGADSRPLIRKWIDRGTPVANPLPIYRPAVAPWPTPPGDNDVRQCYAPTEADIERVRRLFPDHPRPEAPPWYEVARRLIQAGHKQTELVVTQAPVLLELLEQSAPPTPQSLGHNQGEGETGNASRRSGQSRSGEKLSAIDKAYITYRYAEEKNGRRLTDREAYDWLRENDIEDFVMKELGDYKLPNFETWSRYARKARNALGEQKYSRRAGRSRGASIALLEELDLPSPGDN